MSKVGLYAISFAKFAEINESIEVLRLFYSLVSSSTTRCLTLVGI
jgi:hypothetical protein